MQKHICYKIIRKILRQHPYKSSGWDYTDQEANNYILNQLKFNHDGLMISKFGTIELDNIICYEANKRGITLNDYIKSILGRYSIYIDDAFSKLCYNAGFFPKKTNLLQKYDSLVRQDMAGIDILGSYLKAEDCIKDGLSSKCIRVNLDGYYAPFLWETPWTSGLKNKKVLVVHPFTDSIRKQYDRRKLLFENPDVLPLFSDLYLIKAVQSIADNDKNLPYKDWFEALEDMKTQMDKYDYDVALIGCGAYGMHLAAHAKRKGKIAVHLAGWTQMLFGIYGNRWIKDQPQYSHFINKYWIRPSEGEKPNDAIKVENACYW